MITLFPMYIAGFFQRMTLESAGKPERTIDHVVQVLLRLFVVLNQSPVLCGILIILPNPRCNGNFRGMKTQPRDKV